MELHVWMQMSELFAWTLLFFPCPKSGSWDMKKNGAQLLIIKVLQNICKIISWLVSIHTAAGLKNAAVFFLPVGSSCTVCSCIVLFSAVYYFPLLIFILIIFVFFYNIFIVLHIEKYTVTGTVTLWTPPPTMQTLKEGKKQNKQADKQQEIKKKQTKNQ